MSENHRRTTDACAGLQRSERAYPAAAHVRGAFAHLAFGLAVAAVTDAAWAMLARRP